MRCAKEHAVYDVGLPADTVEVLTCGLTAEGERLISVGTYLYDEERRSRSGFFKIFAVSRDYRNIREVSKLEGDAFPGILNAKWSSMDGEKATGTLATSDGTLLRVSYTAEAGLRLLEKVDLTSGTAVDASITMDCDVSTDEGRLTAAMSSGCVVVVDPLVPAGREKIKAHDLEAWTVCFDTHQPHLLHSGGDDARWRGWDLRCPSSQPAFTNAWHSAGVCSIQPHPRHPLLIATGSYDKRIALWDRRQLRRPMKTLDPAAASGVWKLRWHPRQDEKLLVACMYDGFYVYKVPTLTMVQGSPSSGPVAVCAKFDPQALSYGCAWLDDYTAVSCSFYNHQLQIWPAFEI